MNIHTFPMNNETPDTNSMASVEASLNRGMNGMDMLLSLVNSAHPVHDSANLGNSEVEHDAMGMSI